MNTYDDIIKAFAPYYTTTLLANSVTPTAVYDLEAKLDGYMILDPYDVNMAAEIIYKRLSKQRTKSVAFLSATCREETERIRIDETNRDYGGRAAFYSFLRVPDTGIVFRGRGTA